MARARTIKTSLITLHPSLLFHLVSSSFLFSPRRTPRNHRSSTSPNLSLFFLCLLISFAFLGVSVVRFVPASQGSVPCANSPFSSSSLPAISPLQSRLLLASSDDNKPTLSNSVMVPLPARGVAGNISKNEREFWEQPDGKGYKPCLDFSIGYRKASGKISKEKKKFLVVVVSGGLNQQRNQIVDAVVIARILEAALVVPVLQVNLIWNDESEFSDIFDVNHFKRILQADVRVVSSLPSTHLMSRQSIETKIPRDVSPQWIRARFFKQLTEEGLLVLKGLDSKLSKNLPPDLQKLRCKVAFHALRFATPIRELGHKLARRMWIEGTYIAVHLRLEKDVWVRTGCLTGQGSALDAIIAKTRSTQPEYLTGTLNLTHAQRRSSGLCPLNALEMARLLKALGAPRHARVYSAGGEPFGGPEAVQPLVEQFPNYVTKHTLARDAELSPYVKKSSALAAIDYIVSLSSDVFLASHGGNMARAMQGHRAYVGHRKFIRPNKRAMLRYLDDASISETKLGIVARTLHRKSVGQPEPRLKRKDRDVIAYPVPECMCKRDNPVF